MTSLIIAGAALAGLVLLSLLVERLRTPPAPPPRLPWAPTVPIESVTVDGLRLRYIATGSGPPVLLLHTLRTQLDMFQKVVPRLAERFRVYAVDYPGHGYSDIPDAPYSAEFFVGVIAGLLEALDLRNVVIAGESIGGAIGLALAGRRNPRVAAVLAVNPYDYDAGRGLRRSSSLANLLFGLNDVPVVGATVTRLRTYPIVKRVLEGGVVRRESLPSALARELYAVGNRRGHARAFSRLVRNWSSWERVRTAYGGIAVPVLLLYGDRDWSRREEREADAREIPGARLRIAADAGHFLSLDAPDEIVRAVGEIDAIAARPSSRAPSPSP